MRRQISLEDMPINLARVAIKAKQTLNSDVPSATIERYSGVQHSTIYRVRRNLYRIGKYNQKTSRWTFNKLTLKTMLLLANYPNKSNIIALKQMDIIKDKYQYFLDIAKLRYNVDFADLEAKLYDVTHTVSNLSELGRELAIPRTQLSRIKLGKYKIGHIHIDELSILLKVWSMLYNKTFNTLSVMS